MITIFILKIQLKLGFAAAKAGSEMLALVATLLLPLSDLGVRAIFLNLGTYH